MKTLTYIIIVILAVAAVFSIIFGSYMPWRKAQAYINASRATPSVHTVQQFEQVLDTVFNTYSPIGEEEVTKFSASEIMSIVSQKETSEEVSRALVTYIEPHLFKDNVRHLLTAAYMYNALWKRFGKPADAMKAETFS